ncbi:MAG: hypothetical protein VXW22_08755, partial [Pseudomonadota bacterium]|nr:hypothetical protein [Pseudomonadota bacterium]
MPETELMKDEAMPKVANPADAAHVQAIVDRRKRRPLPPEVEFTAKGRIAMCGDDGALAQLRAMASTGLHNAQALALIVHQLAHLNPDSVDQKENSRVNAALALMDELEPLGAAQTMLAAQMVATHMASMSCFSRAAIGHQTFEGREMALKFGTKLSGLYARQAETLAKLKRKGQQT